MAKTRLRQFLDATAEKPALSNTAFALILLLLLGVVIAVWSTAPDPLADQNFTTGQPCAAPCWYGLELGKSTKAETLDLLPKLEFIDPASIRDQGTAWGSDDTAREVSSGCIHPRLLTCGSAVFSGDKLRALRLSVNYELTLKMAIDKLGQPTYIDYGRLDPAGCTVEILWPDQSIAVDLGGVREAVCQALRSGKGLSADYKLTDIYYTEDLKLPKPPGTWCTRITWPAFTVP